MTSLEVILLSDHSPIKVVGAGCRDHPVSCDSLAIRASEADVNQSIGVQKMLKRGQRVEAVVIPL